MYGFFHFLYHDLGKDLAGFVSGVGCQVFHGISGF
jgi:hypothetical protein